VKRAYGNEVLKRSKVFGWYSRFRDGRELVDDNEGGGRPKSTRTEVAAVADLVKNDRRIASRMIECLNILRILKEDLGKRKLCARFVPHSLAPEQREDRVTSCQDIIAMADDDNFFLTKLLREMRPGVLPMTPKQIDRVLNRLVRSPRPKKLKFQRSHIKTTWKMFLDSQGVVYKEFVPEGKTVNAEFCEGLMDRLLKRIQRVRSAVENFACCTIMRPPTKLQMFANF